MDPVYARKYEDGSGGRIEALVPLSLLGALAEMEEVVLIETSHYQALARGQGVVGCRMPSLSCAVEAFRVF